MPAELDEWKGELGLFLPSRFGIEDECYAIDEIDDDGIEHSNVVFKARKNVESIDKVFSTAQKMVAKTGEK